jgi:hypothetical protein
VRRRELGIVPQQLRFLQDFDSNGQKNKSGSNTHDVIPPIPSHGTLERQIDAFVCWVERHVKYPHQVIASPNMGDKQDRTSSAGFAPEQNQVPTEQTCQIAVLLALLEEALYWLIIHNPQPLLGGNITSLRERRWIGSVHHRHHDHQCESESVSVGC